MYRSVFEAYAAALKNRKDVIGSIGPKTPVGQALPVAGLVPTTAATVTMPVGASAAIGA